MNIRESMEALEEQYLSPYASFSAARGAGTGRKSCAISGRSTSGTGTGFCTARRSAA